MVRLRERGCCRSGRHSVDGSLHRATEQVLGVDLGDGAVDQTPQGLALGGADFVLRLKFVVVFGEAGDVLVEKVGGCG